MPGYQESQSLSSAQNVSPHIGTEQEKIKCYKCKCFKWLIDFHVGRNLCKSCTKIYQKQYYIKNKNRIDDKNKRWKNDNIDKFNKYQKRWHKENAERSSRVHREWYEKNREKALANSKKVYRKSKDRRIWYYKKISRKRKYAMGRVNWLVKIGVLKKTSCQVCHSKERIHGHHSDYNKPEEVIWLCHRCHRGVHRKYDPIRLEEVLR